MDSQTTAIAIYNPITIEVGCHYTLINPREGHQTVRVDKIMKDPHSHDISFVCSWYRGIAKKRGVEIYSAELFKRLVKLGGETKVTI